MILAALSLFMLPQSPAAAWLENNLDALTVTYKELHAAPELSLEESASAARLAKQMRDLGFEVTEGVGDTGLVAVLRNGEGPTVLVRCDMDALPIVEQTDLAYASTVTRDARLRP